MSASSNVLTVAPADEAAEIVVTDADLNPVAQGVGRFQRELPAGLYKIRVRVGPKVEEQLVSLDRDREVSIGALEFPSPIPLVGTSRNSGEHRAAAIASSMAVRATFGTGASVFVFAREWTRPGDGTDGAASLRETGANPAAGLSLRDDSGARLATIAGPADSPGKGDPAVGWRADLAPGPYRLRLELDDGYMQERSLFAAPNCQTQIFLLQRDHGLSDGSVQRRPDLLGATVTISRKGKFDPNDRQIRLSEIACYALAQHRHILSDDLLDELLNGKFDDPVLGLAGAHLMLRDHPEDDQRFRIVTDNLLRLLGPDHPDLRALWLARSDRSGIPDVRLVSPPMLRASWDLGVQKSVESADIIPTGTSCSEIADRILPTAPWLLWRAEHVTVTEAVHRLNAKLAAVHSYLGARAAADAPPATGLRRFAQSLPIISRYFLSRADGTAAELSPQEKAELARTLGVPGHLLDAMLKRLAP